MTVIENCPLDPTSPAFFCAIPKNGTGRSMCFGDSGSPLVHGGRLVGLANAVDVNQTDKCIGLGYFVNVPHFYQWIRDIIFV